MFDPITGLLTPVAVLALINLAKRVGLPSRFAMLAAIVVAMIVTLANYFLDGNEIWGLMVQTLILALSASGFWDIAKTVTAKDDSE